MFTFLFTRTNDDKVSATLKADTPTLSGIQEKTRATLDAEITSRYRSELARNIKKQLFAQYKVGRAYDSPGCYHLSRSSYYDEAALVTAIIEDMITSLNLNYTQEKLK